MLCASNYYRTVLFYILYTKPRRAGPGNSAWVVSERQPLINIHIERIYIGGEGAKLPAYLVSGCDGKRQR
jgi:hypothetical protein